jgi:hypothetical protein
MAAAPIPNIEEAFTTKHGKAVFRPGEITGEEVVSRIFTVVFTWIGTCALNTGFYSASAFFFCGM